MRKCPLKILSVARKKHEIIRIADEVFRFEYVLHVLVKLVHIDVDEQLTRQVAEREPPHTEVKPRYIGRKAGNNLGNEGTDALIWDEARDDIEKNSLINRGEKFAYIALEYPAGASVIFGYFVCVFTKAIYRLIRALALSAGIRV